MSQRFVPTDEIKVDQLVDPPSPNSSGKAIRLVLSFALSSNKAGEV